MVITRLGAPNSDSSPEHAVILLYTMPRARRLAWAATYCRFIVWFLGQLAPLSQFFLSCLFA